MFNILKKKGLKLVKRKKEILKYGIPLFVILLLINTIQIARLGQIIEGANGYKEGLVDELGGFRQDINNFGNDINEMRNYLLMPTKDYSFSEEVTPTVNSDQRETTETERALYEFMGTLVSNKLADEKARQAQATMESAYEDKALRSSLAEQGLLLSELKRGEESISFDILTASEMLFEVLANLNDGSLKISTAIGEGKTLKGNTAELLRTEISYYTQKNKGLVESVLTETEANKSLVENLMKEGELLELLSQKKLRWAAEGQKDETIASYLVLNGDEVTLLTIEIGRQDGKIQVNGQALAQKDDLNAMLISAISQLDGTTTMDKVVMERRTEFEGVMKEEAFSELLKTAGLRVAENPREEFNKLLYDVTDSEEKLQFSFVIELSSGIVKILKNNQETDLFSALGENSKKKL